MTDKLVFDVKDNHLVLGLDADKDGVKSLDLKLSLTEAVQEAFAKGTAVEGVKSASIRFEGMSLVIVIDTDKDGEALLTFTANLPEGIKETGILK